MAVDMKTVLRELTRGIVDDVNKALRPLIQMDDDTRMHIINEIRLALHEMSPMSQEPVDCVQWLKTDQLHANDYNPNNVAPAELRLLRHSILSDGYTQPIVAWEQSPGHYEVVDGFHRYRLGRESKVLRGRIKDRLPVIVINKERGQLQDRIAATIRHNRARGKHHVTGLSHIVVELGRLGWDEQRISAELGMDADEVLRMQQVSGLAELFANQEFAEAWDIAS